MKTKLILGFALIVVGFVSGLWLLEHHRPNRILRRMSNYYTKLNSFECVNTIVVQFAAGKTTNQKQFAFMRPNRFVILPDITNASQLYCDGTNLYDYRPYYFNSYTRVPAPARFEDVITNWIGGELLRVIMVTNRLEYLMNGFGRGLTTLKYVGHEAINDVDWDHLYFQEPASNVMELWVARGVAPYAVKYAYAFQNHFGKTNQVMHYTETISDWKEDYGVPPEKFIFSPPNRAVERPLEDDQVELSELVTNGTERQVVRFYSSQRVADEAKRQAEFLKTNQNRFRNIALKAVLAKYANLAAGDLVFKGVEQPSGDEIPNSFIVTFVLSKTIKETETGKSIQTSEETFTATLSTEGSVEHIGRGSSFDFHSK